MADDQYPELTACCDAKRAIEEFDNRHAAKAQAIKMLAATLEQGGWDAVKFEEETSYAESPSRRIPSDISPVSLRALGGDTVEQIVRERRRLLQAWELAYQAVPERIRASASRPGRGSLSTLLDRPRRR